MVQASCLTGVTGAEINNHVNSEKAYNKQLAELLLPVFTCYADILSAVYLFGSQASGEATALSDLDLAVLLKPAAVRNAASHRFTLFAECSSQ